MLYFYVMYVSFSDILCVTGYLSQQASPSFSFPSNKVFWVLKQYMIWPPHTDSLWIFFFIVSSRNGRLLNYGKKLAQHLNHPLQNTSQPWLHLPIWRRKGTDVESEIGNMSHHSGMFYTWRAEAINFEMVHGVAPLTLIFLKHYLQLKR